MARPSKFTPELRERLLAERSVVSTNEEAARAAGVTRRTIQNWLEYGKSGDARFTDFYRAWHNVVPLGRGCARRDARVEDAA